MSSPAITVWPETSIKEAATILTDKGISALETNADPRSQATPIPPRYKTLIDTMYQAHP